MSIKKQKKNTTVALLQMYGAWYQFALVLVVFGGGAAVAAAVARCFSSFPNA